MAGSGGSPAPAAFSNVYADDRRADAYARLEFPGTYYLAFRDLPKIIGAAPRGGQALDFGCGAGRSTRFLRRLGFAVVGIDISEQMVARARAADSVGDYRTLPDGDLSGLPDEAYDVVLSAFTFDNIPTWERKEALFASLGRTLRPGGRIVNLVSSPLLYVHEWASFSTQQFTENTVAKTGDVVRTIILDVDDLRPVDDIFWTDDDYREVYRRAGLRVLDVHRPLGTPSDPCAWVTEHRIPPWVIWELAGKA
jgi:SAM-dependent methyltransferase